jgi:hypothetical protein
MIESLYPDIKVRNMQDNSSMLNSTLASQLPADYDYQDLGINKAKIVLIALKAIFLFTMFFKGMKAHKSKKHINQGLILCLFTFQYLLVIAIIVYELIIDDIPILFYIFTVEGFCLSL